MFKLRFPQHQVVHWAARYLNRANDHALRVRLRPLVRTRGCLTRDEFLAICRWKSPRSQSWCAQNDDFTVRTVTRAAFGLSDESLKIDLLRTLKGVGWPTASTLLHFCDRRPYPILDFRALWSLGHAKAPAYTTDFWLAYLRFTRALARRLALDIGTLDRALWQYSKERQRSARSGKQGP
ncbi:MAG: hypothetical protein ACTHM9_03025 [Gemmatimonadales bacterium]